MKSWTSWVLWLVYLSLLGVLLPHTAWAFSRFEPETIWGQATGWAAAFAFEAAIAVLTHKLAKHIEQTPRRVSGWMRWRFMYVNAFAVGLVLAISVSALANLAHAVEFGKTLAVFERWGIPFGIYAVVFGAILPVVSLVFARVLSNVSDSEQEDDPELTRLREEVRELRTKLRESERGREEAERRFEAAGDVMAALMAENKRERILAIRERWPELPGRAIAVLAESSPAYVSEVLNEK